MAVAAALPASSARQGPPAAACPAPPAATAESLVAAGRYWHALRAAPPLPPGLRPAPVADVLLHLKIAEGLGQLSRIGPLLRRVSAPDTSADLLAIAARDDERQRRWSAAAEKYRRLGSLSGVTVAGRATAATRLAVALEHAGTPGEAAAAWRAAGAELPAVADWFAVRLALMQGDTVSAAHALAAAATPGAVRAADSLLARGREANGDLAGALAVYLARGASLQAARVELALGRAVAARERADSVLLPDPARLEAFDAAQLLASRVRGLTGVELLGISRAFAARGRLLAAERWAQRAADRGDAGLTPWLELAALRARADRYRGALAALNAAVRARGARGAQEPPAVVRARVQVLGAAGRWQEAGALAARAALGAPGDSDIAAGLLLLSDHERTSGATVEERALYQLLLERFGGTRAAAVARFRLALADYTAGRRDTAAALLGPASARAGGGGLWRAWRYWAARVGLERRDPAAPGALRTLAAERATDYYGVRALELLDDSLPLAPDTAAPPASGRYSAARARERILILARVGLVDEARAEARGWLGAPGVSAPVLVEAAAGAAAAGLAPEAMLLGEAARRRGGLTPAVARALFPYPYRSVIEAEAAEQCVDPLFLAAVVRQESRFQLRARSRAEARGLIQVLPRTGAELSRQLHLTPWSPQLLDVADFNLHLGARYVRDRGRRDSLPLYALITSYIAGRTGVTRWRRRPEFQDVDLFIERLPSAGIADYVRNVFANYAWYRRLYAPAEPAAP